MVLVNSNDVILTGVPRGGTTLACQLLHQCEGCVSLFEPIDISTLPRGDRAAAVGEILRFFAQTRAGILRDGSAPSEQVDGQVPDNPFASTRGTDGGRERIALPGCIRIEPVPTADFTLVVKHNASFTALLPQLAQNFRVLAIVRHPLPVLASWNSVDLPVRGGRIPAGERFDPVLAASLDAEPDRLQRQLLVLDWFFVRFHKQLPAADVLRYEDIVASQGECLRERAGLSCAPAVALSERNANSLYSRDEIPRLAAALSAFNGSWQHWYPSDSITAMAERLLANPGQV